LACNDFRGSALLAGINMQLGVYLRHHRCPREAGSPFVWLDVPCADSLANGEHREITNDGPSDSSMFGLSGVHSVP
jgi:hypothetical protein